MSRSTVLKEDLELDAIRQEQQQLLLLEKKYAKLPGMLAREQKEKETTMPPLPEIEERRRRVAHENIISRRQVKNILRNQNRSVTLTILLLAATGTLIWWSINLMQG